MKNSKAVVTLLLFLFASAAQSFVTPSRFASPATSIRGGDTTTTTTTTTDSTATSSSSSKTTELQMTMLPAALETVGSFLTNNLQSGPLGVVALFSIAASVCLPITQIKSLYGIGVGYGGSVAAIGLALRTVLAPTKSSLADILTQAVVFYGVRLAGYLLLRDLTSWKKVGEGREEPARWKRVPFALSLALFYALMTTPVLYVLRFYAASSQAATAAAAAWQTNVSWAGTFLAWAGALLEMTADTKKYIVKQKSGKEGADTFQGPTDGVYAITRHPNYTGEVLFWTGVWLAGAPAFGRSAVAWLCSTAGLYGIVSIMRKATQGLEKRQEEKYGGQGDYESWKSNVQSPLFPFVKWI